MTPAIARAAGFFGFWLVLTGLNPAERCGGAGGGGDCHVGKPAVVAGGLRWSACALLRRPGSCCASCIIPSPPESTWRGARARSRARLRPGFIVYQPRLPPGPARNAFCTITSLLPGSLPSGPDATRGIVVHCLDTSQPVAEQLAAEEALLIEAFGGRSSDG